MTAKADAAIRGDCLLAASSHVSVLRALAGSRLAVTGGTGFLGTWIAEMVTALNDEFKLGVRLEVIATDASGWVARHPHLGSRPEIGVHNHDVRSSLELPADVRYVIHAAGIPDGRVHASDPLRVFETGVIGTSRVLAAVAGLAGIAGFLHVSSGLVYGGVAGSEGFREDAASLVEVGAVGNVYADSKRAAESLCAIYRSQFRLPVVTVRPFTFMGPFQALNRPWAFNNFLRDGLGGREIRVHGDGEARRSFLYGSDAAAWALVALVKGESGRVYNLGSAAKVSIRDLAEQIAAQIPSRPGVLYRTLPAAQLRQRDFFPATTRAVSELGLHETVDLPSALAKTIAWYKKGDAGR